MKISFEKAKEISIAKWTGEVNGTSPVFNLTIEEKNELRDYYNCGFCWRHGYNMLECKEVCINCEFGKVAGICADDNSLYDQYIDAEFGDENTMKKIAKEILEIIKNLKEE